MSRSRRLSGLNRTELVSFIFSWCQDPNYPQFHCITEKMLRGVGINDLDRARFAINKGNCLHSKLLRSLSQQADASLAEHDRRQAVNEIWQFCKSHRLDRYLSLDMIATQSTDELYTARSAIRHDSFPQLLQGLLEAQKDLL